MAMRDSGACIKHKEYRISSGIYSADVTVHGEMYERELSETSQC
jgi:hypothetical protein